MNVIHKVAAVVLREQRLLVVRKRDTRHFILPGGKPEPGEGELDTLSREVSEELGCGVQRPRFLGEFTGPAAGIADARVVVRAYAAHLVGAPRAQAEIEETAWVDIRCPDRLLAPSIIEQIIPRLLDRASEAEA